MKALLLSLRAENDELRDELNAKVEAERESEGKCSKLSMEIADLRCKQMEKQQIIEEFEQSTAKLRQEMQEVEEKCKKFEESIEDLEGEKNIMLRQSQRVLQQHPVEVKRQ